MLLVDFILHCGPPCADVFRVGQQTEYGGHGLLHGELYLHHADDTVTV